MCDCYSAKCEGCGEVWLELHIADFCTERKNVHPYCPSCLIKGLREFFTEGGRQRLFVDMVEYEYNIWKGDSAINQEPVGKDGDLVIILCDNPRAYGVRLN